MIFTQNEKTALASQPGLLNKPCSALHVPRAHLRATPQPAAATLPRTQRRPTPSSNQSNLYKPTHNSPSTNTNSLLGETPPSSLSPGGISALPVNLQHHNKTTQSLLDAPPPPPIPASPSLFCRDAHSSATRRSLCHTPDGGQANEPRSSQQPAAPRPTQPRRHRSSGPDGGGGSGTMRRPQEGERAPGPGCHSRRAPAPF